MAARRPSRSATPTDLLGVALTLALVLVALLPTPAARACSCAPPELPGMLHEADAAFVGTITSRGEPTPGPDGMTSSGQLVPYEFAVESVAKGDLGPTVVLDSPASGASCGVEGPGRLGVLLEGSAELGWTSDLCRLVPVDELAAVADLQPPTDLTPAPSAAPSPEAAAAPSAAPPATPPASGLAALGLVALVVVGGAVVLLRRS